MKQTINNYVMNLGVKIFSLSLRKIAMIVLLTLLVLGIAVLDEAKKFPNGKLQIVVCDVGQGDAIYIKTPHGNDILIDGGPDDKVLSCLGRHMNFWNRKIETVFLTHPQQDHLYGLVKVFQKYDIDHFFFSGVQADSELLRQFAQIESSQSRTNIAKLAQGDSLETADGVKIEAIWPTQEFMAHNTTIEMADNSIVKISDSTKTAKILGAKTTRDLNDFSLVLNLKYGQYSALFMGDAGSEIEETIVSDGKIQCCLDFLKIPHHGSKTGLNRAFLETVGPKTAAISVGKNNKFGHPASEILSELNRINSKIFRTDQDGEVVVEW